MFKTGLCIISAFFFMTSSVYALEVKDLNNQKIITFDSESNYVAFEVFNAMASFLTDPLESHKYEYTGKNYHIKEYNKDDNDMDFSYKIKLILDPVNDRLEIKEGAKFKIVTFEGKLASLILKGLLFRRIGSEDFYPLTVGKYAGTFTIDTQNGLSCKYDYRENEQKLSEKYAQCEMQFHL